MKYKELISNIAKKDKMLSLIMSKNLMVKIKESEIILTYTNNEMFNQANLNKEKILNALDENNINKSLIILHDETRKEELEKIKKIKQQPKIQKLLTKFKISSIRMAKNT